MVEQVASTGTGGSTDTEGVAEAELIELVLTVEVLAVVGLVCHEHDGKFGAAQDEGNVLVEVGEAVLDIDQEQHEVGLLSSNDDLLANLLLEDVVAVDNPAASIDH